jgi:hypothetical protein
MLHNLKTVAKTDRRVIMEGRMAATIDDKRVQSAQATMGLVAEGLPRATSREQEQLNHKTTTLNPEDYRTFRRAIGNLGSQLEQQVTLDKDTSATIIRSYKNSGDDPTVTIKIGDQKVVVTPTPDGKATVSGITSANFKSLVDKLSEAANPYRMNL